MSAGVLVQHGIKVTAESTGNFPSTLLKSYRSVAFLLNNFQLAPNEVLRTSSVKVFVTYFYNVKRTPAFYSSKNINIIT